MKDIEEIRADVYYEPFEYLCFKYTFKELMLYVKDFALKIDDKIIEVQSKKMLAKSIKKSLDTEWIRQSLAWNLMMKQVYKALKTTKTVKQYENIINEIDDDLLKDAYSLCGEKYEREKMVNMVFKNAHFFPSTEREGYVYSMTSRRNYKNDKEELWKSL